MKVSFNGIYNTNIIQYDYEKYGAYLSNDNKIKLGNKYCTLLEVNCNLADDEYGNDLTHFKTALSKCDVFYQNNCIDNNEPNKLCLFLKREDVKDAKGHISQSVFSINGCPIILEDENILPLYTYMAYFSKKLANLHEISAAGKYYMNFLNKSVDEEARKFLGIG